MKKLKIFLLLSILLCFGFALSSEVHASGPKLFEVGDVLPVTTRLRISWVDSLDNIPTNKAIKTNLGSFSLVGRGYGSNIYIKTRYNLDESNINIYSTTSGFIDPYTDHEGDHAYCDIDTSTWDIYFRTIYSIDTEIDGLFAWQDLNTLPSGYTITFNSNGGTTFSDIEEATELPTLPIPTKENHTFLGWYYDSDFTNEAFAEDPLTGDVTLYAKWVSGKIFEEGDVLPATTQLRISWDNIITDYSDTDGGIYSNDIEFIRWYFPETGAAVLIFLDGYSAITGGPDISAGYIDIDIRHLDTDQRTITEVVTDTPFYWQDMATYDYLDPKPFKAYDVLPATTRLKIYINGIHGDGTARYHISSTTDPDNSLTQGFYMTTVQSGPNYNLVIKINGVTIIEYNSEIEPFPDYVIIDISHLSRSDRTIRYCDYPEEMSVMWEDLNPLDLESIYQEGYSDGHQVAREYYGWKSGDYWYSGEEAWDLGNEYARGIYGYYDPNTDEWLSVAEYLNRYGTDKMDQTDFYNNFDKYFIPAMIIVFGGAIVLTILKVFKGRE